MGILITGGERYIIGEVKSASQKLVPGTELPRLHLQPYSKRGSSVVLADVTLEAPFPIQDFTFADGLPLLDAYRLIIRLSRTYDLAIFNGPSPYRYSVKGRHSPIRYCLGCARG